MSGRSGPRAGRFSRRSLLRGLGAGAALAPLARGRAASAQAAPVGNLLVFYTPNGHRRRLGMGNPTDPLGFDAATGGPGGLTLGSSLAPLLPFQKNVAVIRGLNLKTPTFIASHQDVCRILTCWGAPGGETGQAQFTAFGPSIDQSIGAALGQAPLVVAVDPFRAASHWRTALSWSASGVVAPFTKNHQAVLEDLFGPSSAATALPSANLSSTFDLAALRARAFAHGRARGPWSANAVRSFGQHAASTSPWSCGSSTLGARVAALPAMAPVQVDDKSFDGAAAEMQTRGELWMDMIALAFACGKRRVAVLQWQSASEGYDPAADVGSPAHHSVSMFGFGPTSGDRWAAIDAWYASRFAYQLSSLANLGILDRTIVVWVSEITEGHNQFDMVTVVGGGQALGMKTGQYIRYPLTGTEVEGAPAIALQQNPANRSLSDLWVTVQQAMGISTSTFGDPKWNAGPLTELRG